MFDADLWLYYAVVYTFAEQEKDPSSVLKDDTNPLEVAPEGHLKQT